MARCAHGREEPQSQQNLQALFSSMAMCRLLFCISCTNLALEVHVRVATGARRGLAIDFQLSRSSLLVLGTGGDIDTSAGIDKDGSTNACVYIYIHMHM